MDKIGITDKQKEFLYRNSFCYFSEVGETTEEQETCRVVVVRVQIPVVEVEVLIVSLEVQRVLSRLPYIAFFRPEAPKAEASVSGLRRKIPPPEFDMAPACALEKSKEYLRSDSSPVHAL